MLVQALTYGLEDESFNSSNLMIEILGDDYFKNCIVYADDLIIFTNASRDDHLQLVSRICKKLKDLCELKVEFWKHMVVSQRHHLALL